MGMLSKYFINYLMSKFNNNSIVLTHSHLKQINYYTILEHI